MTNLEIKGDWKITKGKLKEKWAQLTDNDLLYAEGTGETREVVENAIKTFDA